MKPLISVIMPAHNAEKYIRDAIHSVLSQTYPELELIIVNDNSSDSTEQIIKSIADSDSRVVLYTSRCPLGVSAARNTGVAMAQGKWIAFLDSDDAWEQDKLQKQLSLAERTGGSLLFTGSTFMDEHGVRKNQTLEVPETITYQKLLRQNLISCSSVLASRDLMLKHPMKNDSMHEDFAVWLQILRAGEVAYGINEPLLIYRISSKSKSSDKRKAAIMTWRVYRYIGLKLPACVYYMAQYTARSLIKYGKLKKR